MSSLESCLKSAAFVGLAATALQGLEARLLHRLYFSGRLVLVWATQADPEYA